MSELQQATGAKTEPHDWYGPCDGMGPNGECTECARVVLFHGDDAAFTAWLRRVDVRAIWRGHEATED